MFSVVVENLEGYQTIFQDKTFNNPLPSISSLQQHATAFQLTLVCYTLHKNDRKSVINSKISGRAWGHLSQ